MSKSSRPAYVPFRETFDNVIEVIVVLVLVAMWAMVFAHYGNLPDQVPMHFNLEGEADGYGGKGSLLVMPIISTVLTIILSILQRYPNVYNYPVEVTEENCTGIYRIGVRLVRTIKACMVIVFTIIVWQMVRLASLEISYLEWWFFPILLALIFVPIIYFILQMLKYNKAAYK